MNDRLMEFLLKSEVAKLPEEKKRLYQFIVDTEDSLAQRADTADEFHRLMVKHSPYDLASRYFKIPFEKVAELMNDLEAELNEKIEIRYKKVKWIDYTDQFIGPAAGDNRKQVFLLIN